MSALRTACLWPGFVAAWYQGVARGLFVATLFAWTLCVLLLATFIWPEWLALSLVRGLWVVVLVVWGVESVRNYWRLQSLLKPESAESQTAFSKAQSEYLHGNWFEAEALLLEIVHQNPRDAEALLLLVGVLRHSRRWQPALRRLKQLELLDTAARWHFEMQREMQLIDREMAREQEQAVEELATAVTESVQAESEQSASEQSGGEQSGGEQSGGEQTESEQAGLQQAEAEQLGVEQPEAKAAESTVSLEQVEPENAAAPSSVQ
ncbi:hypothetical protein Q31a_55390 [Aureliella helgolandensis]|uniref:Tetratricopeptide repeat protein n=2 Tax=Aureliella helgolandensis TaxID=2527968 RepID=A0A518GEX7_9BACT|nr:hypothetical protein Q31a_55390 [Aureliella helgolandensis]